MIAHKRYNIHALVATILTPSLQADNEQNRKTGCVSVTRDANSDWIWELAIKLRVGPSPPIFFNNPLLSLIVAMADDDDDDFHEQVASQVSRVLA